MAVRLDWHRTKGWRVTEIVSGGRRFTAFVPDEELLLPAAKVILRQNGHSGWMDFPDLSAAEFLALIGKEIGEPQ